ncbi:MAG: DUF4129 domain-containing protein [Tepidibacillus sp.]
MEPQVRKGKEESQTVREYLSDVFKEMDSKDWEEATEVFEQVRFSRSSIAGVWQFGRSGGN